MRFMTGFPKFVIYARIAIRVAAKYLFRLHPCAYAVFLKRALQLLLNFRHNKIVRVPSGYKLQLYLPVYPSKAFFRTIESKLMQKPAGPATVVYSITKACDYNCPHCYQRHDKGSDLTEEKLIETAQQIRNTGVTMFDIEGGEPFLKFDRLCKLVKSLNNGVECWVNTHGGGVDEARLVKLKELGLFGLMISIHSPNSEEHDNFTGKKGSFESACKTAELCKKVGLTVSLNSVLSAEQLENGQLDELMGLARQLDSDFVQLIHPKPAGKWLSSDDKIRHNDNLIKKVEERHIIYNSRKCKNYPALVAQVFEERIESLGCTAGAVDRFYVNAVGEIQPCEFLNISFGNVNEEDFIDIFTRMRSHFQTPCSDWICCTMSSEIAKLIDKHGLETTPVPWKYTQELVKSWGRGKATKLYKKLGIYR